MELSNNRFYYLDLSRAGAAIGVVFFHSAFSPQTFWSLVDYFFVLSGFVLYPNYSQHNSLKLNSFLVKRYLYFVKLSFLSILLTVIVFISQLSYENVTNQYGDKMADFPGKWLSVPFAILLFQIVSQTFQIVNPPLWSLSAEFVSNLMAKFLPVRNAKLLLALYSFATFFFCINFIHGAQNEMVVGWTALYRVFVGFYCGLFSRIIFERLSIRNLTIKLTIFPIIIVFLGSQLCASYLGKLAIPLLPFFFGSIVICFAKTRVPRNLYFTRTCRAFGKFSVGIYIFQSPVEPIAAYLSDFFVGLIEKGSAYLAIYGIIKILLCILTSVAIDKFIIQIKPSIVGIYKILRGLGFRFLRF